MKQIKVTLEKNKDGYILSSEEFGKVFYFHDQDNERKALIKEVANLVMDLMNTEIDSGSKYI